jgi:anaerobic selenocysteine-containing dehydrogenase
VHGQDALILPCLARSDIDIQATGRQSITVEDSMSMVHASGGLVEPPSENLKSEVSIVCGMARATLPDGEIGWDRFEADYSLIRDKIEAIFPKLFTDFNARIGSRGGFHLYNGPRAREWKTASGRANFLFCEGVAEDPDAEDPAVLYLTTIRSHDQYNTTIYGFDDRYRGVFGGRMVVFMNTEDMAEHHIEPNSLVDLESVMAKGDVRRTAAGFKVKAYNIRRGSIAAIIPRQTPCCRSAITINEARRHPQSPSQCWSGQWRRTAPDPTSARRTIPIGRPSLRRPLLTSGPANSWAT